MAQQPGNKYDDLDSSLKCPKCGSNALYQKELPGNRLEIMCLASTCSHTWTAAGHIRYPSNPMQSFARRIEKMSEDQLRRLAENLRESSQTLTGRSAQLAQRQLAFLNDEIQKKFPQSQPQPPEKKPASRPNPQKAPPQFKTEKARVNRIKGIREYYQQYKKGSALALSPNRWFDTLLKNLQDEAARHEQAAHHYARVPDLSALHIEHSARAFELKRIVDMLANHIKAIFPETPT